MGSARGWLAGDWPSRGAFSTLLRRPGLRASSEGILATKSERKMLAGTCLYSLYAWLTTVDQPNSSSYISSHFQFSSDRFASLCYAF